MRLKELREKEHISQQAIANRLGCTVKTYRSWECGGVLPNSRDLIELSHIFHVSADYILGLTDYCNIGNREISEITGLSDASIEFLRYLNYCGNHYVYDHPGNVNRQTITFINRVLEAEGEHATWDEDGDTKFKSTLFRVMEQYVNSAASKGTVSEFDKSTGSMKWATGELILFEDPNMPSTFDISTLRREALMSQIRNYLEYFRKKEEDKNNG